MGTKLEFVELSVSMEDSQSSSGMKLHPKFRNFN